MQDFPPGFFDRDDADDARFYVPERLVTHIDPGAVAAVTALYDELGLPEGEVLDLMSSWISHFSRRPLRLTVLGMNRRELEANPQADELLVHDLNAEPALPFADAAFDAVTCCVSVDYLTRPVEVLSEVARVLRPGGVFVATFSNRCFPTKAIRGWLATTDEQHLAVVSRYLELAGGFEPARAELRTPLGARSDPLWAVWATRQA